MAAIAIIIIIWSIGFLSIAYSYLRDNSTGKDLFYNPIKWKPFPQSKPHRDGWFLCTIEMDSCRFPMILYWSQDQFVNSTRQSVFNQYQVMVKKELDETTPTNAIMPDYECMERVTTDINCDLTRFVVAWREEPKAYKGKITCIGCPDHTREYKEGHGGVLR